MAIFSTILVLTIDHVFAAWWASFNLGAGKKRTQGFLITGFSVLLSVINILALLTQLDQISYSQKIFINIYIIFQDSKT